MTCLHAISVDVEDWYQSTIDDGAPLSNRFEDSTQQVLEAFDAAGVKGTFFILGLVAAQAPGLVRAIHQAGHEVQSHGYGHRDNTTLTREQLSEDLTRAKKSIEDITGDEVYGYRAPCFTITDRNLWALDVLVETGHRYDSSIFPLATSRYGIAGYPPDPQIVTTPGGAQIVEAPVACFDWLGKRRPIGGGGYFRLWPYFVIRKAWRQMERHARPGIVYMHPYEYDPREMAAYRDQVSLKQRLHQGLGRKSFSGKIDRLLREFHFGPMAATLTHLLTELS